MDWAQNSAAMLNREWLKKQRSENSHARIVYLDCAYNSTHDSLQAYVSLRRYTAATEYIQHGGGSGMPN